MIDLHNSFATSSRGAIERAFLAADGHVIDTPHLWKVGKAAYEELKNNENIEWTDAITHEYCDESAQELVSSMLMEIMNLFLLPHGQKVLETARKEKIAFCDPYGQRIDHEELPVAWDRADYVTKAYHVTRFYQQLSASLNHKDIRLIAAAATIAGLNDLIGQSRAQPPGSLDERLLMLAHFEQIITGPDNLSASNKRAARARHDKNKPYKEAVLRRYHELATLPHFKSRAEIARKIIDELSLPVTERTVVGWIKEGLEA